MFSSPATRVIVTPVEYEIAITAPRGPVLPDPLNE
jgi:hypothetical protein